MKAIRATRGRKLSVGLLVSIAIAALLPAAISGAAGGSPAVDYSQCANGQPPSTALNCPGGWINGILQASNSHYHEDEVTPQRLIVAVPAAGDHTVTLRYQTRKGGSADGTHAYDSLATWNYTQTNADRCQGLTNPIKNSIGCSTAPDTTASIPGDPNPVFPFATPATTATTSAHQLADQYMEFYSVDTAVSAASIDIPTHDNNIGPTTNDDYASQVVHFTTSSGGNVQIMFGGHLAAPTQARGWGTGLGAANINGGPYHIKWDAFDGASVGRRDNQIMGSAILPLAEPGISTVASPQTATIGTAVTLNDKVSLAGSSDPTGTTTFGLYGPYASSTTPTCALGDLVAGTTTTVSSYTKVGGGTGLGTWEATATVSNFTFTSGSVGDYYWVASFAGDDKNVAAGPEGCGVASEKVTVAKATPTAVTHILIGDTVTVSGAGTPTGTVDFKLYDNSSCTGTPVYSDPGRSLTSGTASTSGTYEATTPTAYYWTVDYSGDGQNTSGTVSNCAEAASITYS